MSDTLGDEIWRPLGGTRIYRVHDSRKCFPNPCPVHRVSDHHMKEWPQNYRQDMGITERICPHGVGHPDPDDVRARGEYGVHGCDGCCTYGGGPK